MQSKIDKFTKGEQLSNSLDSKDKEDKVQKMYRLLASIC
jgi:hypothetical protein